MDPVTLIAAGTAVLVISAVVGAGVQHTVLTRKQSYLRDVEKALDAQRFTVERIEQRYTGRDGRTDVVLTAALVARDERIHVHLAPTWRGASATIVVRGVKAASNATFTVERETMLTRTVDLSNDIAIGDSLFDKRHRINGWPKGHARAFVASQKVKNAIEAMFSFDDVTRAALVAFKDGGAVRVQLDLDKGRIGAVRPVSDLALTCADALDEVRFTDPTPKPTAESALPEGGAGVEGGSPVGVPGIPPAKTR